MKKLLTILTMVLFYTTMFSQTYTNVWNKKDPTDYIYTSLTFDANMAFGIKENKNTVKKDRGFDWDLELGARDGNIAVYLFYGRFDAFDYQNYGAGVDYYLQTWRDYDFLIFDGIEYTLGIYYSEVIRQDYDGNWGSFTSWVSPRAKCILWYKDFGLGLVYKWQGRGDIGKRVHEGGIELIYKFD